MSIAAFFVVKTSKEQSSSLHSHPYWEIVYCEGSGGTLELGGKLHKYTGKTTMVLPPNVPQLQVSSGKGLHWCLLVPVFEGEGLKERFLKDDGTVKGLFRELAEELNGKKPYYRAIMDATAAKILALLKRRLSGDLRMPAADERLSKLRKTIDENIDKNIDLEALAGSFLLSNEYLREVFKKEYGITPVRYIIQKRIEKAKILLSEKKLTVKEAAAVCGFEDEYYFSRLFKKVTSVSPAIYRKKG